MSADGEPQLRNAHASDKYGMKYIDKAQELQHKAEKLTKTDSHSSEQKGPAGGYDATPHPDAPAGYTIRITFHRAENLPFSDFPTFSTDAYIHATFKTDLAKRHKQDPDLLLRTPTIHRNTNPKWETQWVIAHVPASGFFLKCRLYDEDPADHDDRLGNVHVNVNHISDDWQGFKERLFDIKKRMGSKRAYTFRGAAALLRKGVKMSGRLYVSVENLGKSPGDNGWHAYTVAPLAWSRHHSPLIGRLAGTKDREESKDGKKSVERYNFQAVQMQLRGPVPEDMYHRYVEFKPFIAGMFTDHTVRGRILNRALHHQHARIYNFDASTVYGVFERPCIELTKQFLEFVHYDQGGRIYTYVLSLDGLWRFTETGKEFGIDMLSKHTMHSDVSIYIAFSGEFFVRRLKHSRHTPSTNSPTSPRDFTDEIAPPSADLENDSNPNSKHDHTNISKDPSDYELIIDNDSGTYRPNAKLLPLLKQYISQNLPGLKVATLDCREDEEKMQKLKKEQRDRKQSSGKQITYLQNSSMSSFSSSDEEKLEARAQNGEKSNAYKRKLAKYRNKGQNQPGDESDDNLRKDSRDATSTSSAESRLPTAHSNNEGIADTDNTKPTPLDSNGLNPDREGNTYEDRELSSLLKHDRDGNLPNTTEYAGTEGGGNINHPDHPNNTSGDHAYAEPEKGENKPAGGIVYGKIVSTAGQERGSVMGIGDREKDGKDAD